MFMRKLFDAELGTPIESFYLETAAWPIRFILMGRSLMYYWTILNKSESELVKAVYNAQKEYPTKNSWVSEIQGVLKTCEIYNTEEEIKSMTKIKFKAIVKEKIQIRVMCYLIGLQNKHSKSKNLVMGAEMQKYLCCNEMSLRNKKFLFKLRSKMLKIRANFKSKHWNNLKCTFCLGEQTTETETHLLCCPYLLKHKSLEGEIENIQYEDVFEDIPKQIKTVNVFSKIMEIYDVNMK